MRIIALATLGIALAAVGCGGSHGTPPPGAAGPWQAAVTLPAPAPSSSADAVERADGSAIAVWVQPLKGAGARLLAAERSPAGAWGAGVQIAPDSPTPIRAANVVVDSAGVATAAWSVWDRPQGAVFAFVQAARQRPDGGWSKAVTLSRGTNGLFEVAMTAPAAGRVVVAWSGSEARNGAFFARVRSAFRAPDGSWRFSSVAGRLRGDPALDAGSLGSVGTTGAVRLIWRSTSARGAPGGVLTATARADGRWSAPQRLSDEGEQPEDLTVSSAPDTSMVAVWRRHGSGQPRIARAVGTAWTRPHDLPGGPVTEGPDLVAGPHGSALVALQRRRGERSVLQALRVAPNGVASALRDIDVRAVPSAVGTSGRLPIAWDPALALDPDGRAVIAWTRSRQRSDGAIVSDAITARVAAPKAEAWGGPETVVRFGSPVVGVLLRADPLWGGAFTVRWSKVGADRNPGAQQSIRRP